MLIDMTLTAAFRRIYRRALAFFCPRAAERAAMVAEEMRSLRQASQPGLRDEQTQRINLHRTLPSFSSLLCKFFQRLTIQVC